MKPAARHLSPLLPNPRAQRQYHTELFLPAQEQLAFPATFPVRQLLLEEKVPSLLPFALLLRFLGLRTENRSLCSPFSQAFAGTPALMPSYSLSHKKRSGTYTPVRYPKADDGSVTL